MVTTTQSVQSYEGPIPHPDLLRKFDELLPGTAERLINLAVAESEHRRSLELIAMNANVSAQSRNVAISEKSSRNVFISDTLAQVLGASVSLVCAIGAIYLALHEQQGIALALAAIPAAALAESIYSRRSK